jgi:hypothetical protein
VGYASDVDEAQELLERYYLPLHIDPIGATPLKLRLRAVQLPELTDADSRSVTVTSVATRWGSVHLGRFAEQYRQEFGHGPSETLRRNGFQPSVASSSDPTISNSSSNCASARAAVIGPPATDTK